MARQLIRLDISLLHSVLAFVEARYTLMDQIRAHQFEDDKLCVIRDKVSRGEAKSAFLDSDGVLRINGRICVPKVGGWVRLILEEAHCAKYSFHPGVEKMFHDLKQQYWWCGVKKDIAEFVAKCLNCQQVKYEHQKPRGLMQRMPNPEWN
ncbi:MAG: integrase zinc binding domain-containing protein [Candidatus Phytoplasma australasiaticum]|nr:integrase zinc binding domain-containing protein [Candidatus Phytoplasma australasiaticum]